MFHIAARLTASALRNCVLRRLHRTRLVMPWRIPWSHTTFIHLVHSTCRVARQDSKTPWHCVSLLTCTRDSLARLPVEGIKQFVGKPSCERVPHSLVVHQQFEHAVVLLAACKHHVKCLAVGHVPEVLPRVDLGRFLEFFVLKSVFLNEIEEEPVRFREVRAKPLIENLDQC